MRHYVLTRAVYGPEWTREANARRLAVTRAVTASLMAAQTNRSWTWVVLLHPDDPLIDERREVFRSAAPAYREILWRPDTSTGRDDVAFQAYRAPWGEVVGPRDDVILQTRLDDDDGLAPDAIERYQRHPRIRRFRALILVMPRGVRVWAGCYVEVRHRRNAMHTLITQPGEPLGVYDYGHTRCNTVAPVLPVGDRWGWLWVRHRDTLSGYHSADRPISERVRRAFPVDWPALEAAWDGELVA